MRWLRVWFMRLGGLFHRERRDRELAEELESHLQMHIEDNLRAGMAPEEARRDALIKLGGMESTKEAYRDRRGIPGLETLVQDLRYAFRMLRKNSGFSGVGILTLGLGIGSSVAIFSGVNALWFNPVPALEPDRLVEIRAFDKEKSDYAPGVSMLILHELRAKREYFTDLTMVVSAYGKSWENAGWIESVNIARVSPNFFSLWSTRPQLGRTFAADEGQPNSAPSIVLAHGFWKNRLGGDPTWIGKTLHLKDFNGQDQYPTVIGVMPAYFTFPNAVDFWVPNNDPRVLSPDKDPDGYRFAPNYGVIARLSPGVSIQQVQAMLDVVARQYEVEHLKVGISYNSICLRPLRLKFMSAAIQKTIPGFMGGMLFVLLIAGANVTNMNLARMEARQHEMAIRSALGAGWTRLLRQLLLESLILALAGTVVGVLLTYWSFGLMEWILPPGLPRLRPIKMDHQVLVYALLVGVVAGGCSGIVPAWYGARRPAAKAIKQCGLQTTPGVVRNLYRKTLVVLEVFLAMLLLAGAGLMIQSVMHLLRSNPGFEPTGLIDIRIHPANDSPKYQKMAANNLLTADLYQRFITLPGVEAVAIQVRPWRFKWAIPGREAPVELYSGASGIGTADVFKVLRIPLLHGRYFDEQDAHTNATAVLVNETLSRHCWPGENPIGKTIRSTIPEGPQVLEVVGVVANMHLWSFATGMWSVTDRIEPAFYSPIQVGSPLRAYDFFIRTRIKPEGLIKSLLVQVKAAGPELRKPSITVVKESLYESTRTHRAYMCYLVVFGVVGLLLAGSGIYALLEFLVTSRQREIGIRMALGATRLKVLGMVLRQGMTLVGIGLALGVVAACALTRVLRGMLYGINPIDPLTFAMGALLLGLIALLACTLPARRAARIEPMASLRCE